MVPRTDRSEYHFHWPSLFFFSFFFLCTSSLVNQSLQFKYPFQFFKKLIPSQKNPRISVFLRFTTETQINRPVRRYETVRFNWYRQCCIPCYVRPENCLKMFESSCLTAQEVNLQKRRFFWLIKASGDASPFISLVWKTKKITPVLQEFIAWSASGKKAQNHLREGGARSNWSLYFILLGVIQKDGHWSIGLIRDDQIQGLGVFLSHSNQVKTNNRSNILDRFHFYTKKAHVLCWRQKPSFIGETNQVVNRPSQRRHTSDWYCIDIFLRLLWKYLSQDL